MSLRAWRERFGEINSGIVHQRVDRSELPSGSFDNSRGRCRIGNASVNQFEFFGCFEPTCLCNAPRSRHHIVTATEKSFHQTRSDALRAAGHNHCLVDIWYHDLFPFCGFKGSGHNELRLSSVDEDVHLLTNEKRKVAVLDPVDDLQDTRIEGFVAVIFTQQRQRGAC